MPKFIDITGQRFGRLVVLEAQGKNAYRDTRWLCRCDCGETALVLGGNLKSEQIKSCGCLRRERTREERLTHGLSGTSLYRLWSMMLDRCRNPKNKYYKYYGGRGVGVDDPRWFFFQNFYEDMGNKRPPGYDLHRKDNDRGYCKSNCVWLPPSEHMRLHRSKPLRSAARLKALCS